MKLSVRNLAFLGLVGHTVVAFQPSKSVNNNIHNFPTSLAVTLPLGNTEVTQTTRTNRNQNNNQKKKNHSNEKKEFAWLYWLYKQWHDSPVSYVEKSILQQFLPAAQSWKSKQSWLGARRASELVERYCIEYLAGNADAEVSAVPSSQSYFSKLLGAGVDAWLQCKDDEADDPTLKANQLLDTLVAMSDRSILDRKNDSETVARAKILQCHIQEARLRLQEKSTQKPRSSSPAAATQDIAELLDKSLSFLEGRTSRHLEDSLVAMQQIVITLDKMVAQANLELMDALERELVFSTPQQELLLLNSDWLSVALPYFEFLHHSLIRALTNVNQKERAQQSLQQMLDILQRQPQHLPSFINTRRDAKSAILRITSMEDEGEELIQRIKKDKQYQWLNWLSHQLSNSPIGEVSESVLKLVMPAISQHAKRKTKKDAEQAEALLNRYVEEFHAGNSKATLSNSYFNCVCDAWAKLGEPRRAQAILNQLVQLRRAHPENPDLKLDVISLSTLAAAWANCHSAESAKRAEEILRRMEEENMNPTTITYNTVLRALIHSRSVSKAMRAEELVKRMEKRFEEGHEECRPSIRTYQSLISAWSRTDLSGTAQKGEQVLNFLDSKSKEEGFEDLAPNAHCFAAAIHGWAYSREKQKARRAYNILSHMRQLYEQHGREECKPNVVVYTAVINACAAPVDESEKEDAFQIAQLSWDELCYNSKYGWPNFLTFAAFLRVCETTLEPGTRRDETVRAIFSKCCEAGQVGDVVIQKLERAASPELYQELITNTVQLEDGSLDLPRGWTRRVQDVKVTAKPRNNAGKLPGKHRPELKRMQEVRLLTGTAGKYSAGNDKDAIFMTFDEKGF